MISFLLAVRSSYRYALLVIYLGCIMALSLLPPQDLPKVHLFKGADKVIHFGMYLVFAILTAWALKVEQNRSRVLLILPVTIGWGLLMEVFQLKMHMGRSFSMYDMLANTTGVACGLLFYLLITRSAFKKMIGQANS